MQRRTFLMWCVGSAGFAGACVPAAEPRSAKRGGADASSAVEDAALFEDASPSSSDSGAPDVSARDAEGSDAVADAATTAPDAEQPAAPPDAGTCELFVRMHDTHAQALYFDGTYGPLTGVCTVGYVRANVEVDLEFWHGHNGINHHFVLAPEHFAALKRGERVTIETTEVDSHQHLLFIDPIDENYRVDGAPDVDVPVC